MTMRAWTTVAALGAVLLLAGCTQTADRPVNSTLPSDLTTTLPDVTKSPEPTAAPKEAVIVFASLDVDGANVSVSGYVSGVIENDGTCTFSFTDGATTVSATSVGIADRAQTSCGTVQVPIASFTRGSWTAALNYTSPSTPEVSSDTTPLEIP